jgi:beta-phosphoglucomutase
MIKACLFDMDGVIVDTAKYHFLAWQRLAETLGVPFTEAQNEQLKGVSRADSLERILSWGNITLSQERKDELMTLKNDWYLEYVATVTPSEMFPGVHSFLNELKADGIKIGLGSSSKNAMLILEKLAIIGLFDVIVDGNKVTVSKPNPEVFIRGAQELDLRPEHIIVFEDAQSGVKAALAGGFRCVGIGEPEVLNEAHVVIPGFNGMTLSTVISLLKGA